MTPKKMNPLVACLRFCATLITTASAFKFSSNSDSVYTTDTTPYKTIRFVGSATSSLNLDNVVKEEERRDYKTSASPRSFKSLSKFLSSDASNAVLLGTPDTKLVRSTAGDFWVCRMESIGWFGMTLFPTFVHQIKRGNADNDEMKNQVTLLIVDSTVDANVVQGGMLGSAIASSMKTSVFEGKTTVTWKELPDSSYQLTGDITLTLVIKRPPLIPLPIGFNAIGSKIVERACRERLKQYVRDISEKYDEWANRADDFSESNY